METWQEIEQRRADIARHESNRAAQAASFIKVHTDGQGPYEFENAIRFETAFVEEPWVSYSAAIDGDSLRESLQMADDEVPPFPLVSGFVTEWEQNHNGLYVGAWVGVRVHFPYDVPVALDTEVSIDHYFRFEAIGLKVLA